MTFKIIISSAIVSAVITVLGNLIATKITQKSAEKIARETTSHEIEKMERTWQREDIVSSDEEFAEMAKAVAKVCDHYCYQNQQVAIGMIASVRSKESGQLGSVLDDLYNSVRGRNNSASNENLTKAIDVRRALRSSSTDNSQV